MLRNLFIVIVICWSVPSSNGFARSRVPETWGGIRPHYEDKQPYRTSSGITSKRFEPQMDGKAINLLHVVRQYLQEHPSVIDSLDRMISSIVSGSSLPSTQDPDPWECPNQGPDVCLDRTLTPVVGDAITFLRTTLRRAAQEILSASDDCEPCLSMMGNLQMFACSDLLTWEIFRDELIVFCEAQYEMNGNDPVVCNGTITLQGKHIYCILQEASTRDMCESLNHCYTPDTRVRPPVSERTPWKVKENRGQEQRTSTKGKKRKHARDGLLMAGLLTDIHLQMDHLVGSNSDCPAYVCCLDDSLGSGPAREYGEYKCNLPPRTMDLFLNRVAQAHPDFILYPGDSPPHNMWEETMTSQLNCSQQVVDAMSRTFPEGINVYPNLGNHEMYPTNLFSMRMEETKFMKDGFVKMWHKFAGFDDSANGTFGELGYYTTTVPGHPKLRIVSVNSNYDWYPMNFYSALNRYSAENERHKQWVNDTLTAARGAGEKVIIISHHPIGSSANVRTSRWWEEVAKAFGDVIVMHVSGHTHVDQIKLSFDPDTMEAVSVNTIVASASAKTNINPTMRMFYLDPEDGYSLVDFESFYLDIKTQKQSRGVQPAIAFSYNALDEYGMPDLSPSSWKELVLRFIDDDDLFQKYYRNRNSHSTDNYCDYDCKMGLICSIWFGELDEAEECRNLAPPELSPTEQFNSGSVLSHTFALVVVCLKITIL